MYSCGEGCSYEGGVRGVCGVKVDSDFAEFGVGSCGIVAGVGMAEVCFGEVDGVGIVRVVEGGLGDKLGEGLSVLFDGIVDGVSGCEWVECASGEGKGRVDEAASW